MATKTLAPSSVLTTASGIQKTVSEFASGLGCPVQTILGRLARGWPVDRAVSEPVGSTGGSNRGTKAPAEVLTPEELTRLLAACNDGATGHRNRALIVIGWRAGLRISEALSLRLSDLDPAQQTIRVLHGKGDKARTVGLDGQAWAVVGTWLDVRTQLAIDPVAPLFCTLSGGRLNDRYVRELMPRLAQGAGIAKRVHYHGLRHTMACELAGEGVPMHLIQQQLGHSNLAITSRYIAHLNPAETIARMKVRSWGGAIATSPTPASALPSPGWLERLRSEIGPRLRTCIDSRTDQEQFGAVIVLFPI